jgi:hypothetical protein
MIPKNIDFIYGTGQSANSEDIEQTVEEQDQKALKIEPDEEDIKGKAALKGLPTFDTRISVYVKIVEGEYP